jgi:uncharacterized protein
MAGDNGLRAVNVVDFLTAPARQHGSLTETDHRPWPLPPADMWRMGQTWERLLFAHWSVPIAAIRDHVPRALAVDTFGGSAWIGITPFRVSGLRLRGTAPAPVFSSFLELNARTYVTVEDKPGIWFFSLDANSRLAVAAARRAYKLPYFLARISACESGRALRYTSERATRGARPAEFSGRYETSGEVFAAATGSLEHFLTERYCLYAVARGDVLRADIHHKPWPLQPAKAELARNTMAPPGIPTRGEPLLHFADRQDVVIWPLQALRRNSRDERER